MDSKTYLEEWFRQTIDNRLLCAADEYIVRLDELIHEYKSTPTIETQKTIVGQIQTIALAYETLKDAYEEAKQTFYRETNLQLLKAEGYFEAKLKGVPHEWDPE